MPEPGAQSYVHFHFWQNIQQSLIQFLLLRVVVAVVRSLVSDTTGFLVAHSGSSFLEFFGVLPLETFPVDLYSFWICPFLPHLWQVISDLVDYPLPEPLLFPLRRLLKSTCFKALLINCSMDIVYDFGSEGWSWYFYLLVSSYHRFESTTSRYSCVASCTRDS